MISQVVIVQPREALAQMADVVKASLDLDDIHCFDNVKDAIAHLSNPAGNILVLIDINLPVDHECLFFAKLSNFDKAWMDQLQVILTTDRGNHEVLKSLPLHDTVVGVLPVPIDKDSLLTTVQ